VGERAGAVLRQRDEPLKPAEPHPAFLGVGQSVTGRRWIAAIDPAQERLAQAMAQKLGLPEIVAGLLVSRGVTPDEAPGYLEPRLKDLLPDPSCFADMDRTAELVAACVRQDRPIAIFGDYDVDGATSSALLYRFLQAAGGTVRYYIPDRMTEGYGPNIAALRKLHAEGAALVLTVDCGIAAFDVLEQAAEEGISVAVIDHHLAESRLPRAAAIVNPNRTDCGSGLGYLAAVGVAFMLAIAVNRTLRAAGWFSQRKAPDLMGLLDIVALGTVCDVVPLVGLNRALVAQGLKVMARRQSLGLTTLADVARVNGPPGTYHAGFLLGPRVNAGGRVGKADLGARLLTTDDREEAVGIAMELDRLNDERKRIEANVLEEALARVEGQDNRAVTIVAAEGWHPGVIGIVASRLKDRTGRPSLVVALDGALGKGSGRSIRGVDLGAAVTAARQAGLLINGGGHAMAAGITIASDRLDAFSDFLEERLATPVAQARTGSGLKIDGSVAVQGISIDLAETMQRAGPFGAGNPEPRIAVTDAKLVKADVVGENHVRVILSGRTGGRATGIAFRATDGPLGAALLGNARKGGSMHLAGHLRVDHWQGAARAQFIIEDAASID